MSLRSQAFRQRQPICSRLADPYGLDGLSVSGRDLKQAVHSRADHQEAIPSPQPGSVLGAQDARQWLDHGRRHGVQAVRKRQQL